MAERGSWLPLLTPKNQLWTFIFFLKRIFPATQAQGETRRTRGSPGSELAAQGRRSATGAAHRPGLSHPSRSGVAAQGRGPARPGPAEVSSPPAPAGPSGAQCAGTRTKPAASAARSKPPARGPGATWHQRAPRRAGPAPARAPPCSTQPRTEPPGHAPSSGHAGASALSPCRRPLEEQRCASGGRLAVRDARQS